MFLIEELDLYGAALVEDNSKLLVASVVAVSKCSQALSPGKIWCLIPQDLWSANLKVG